jgi:beta-glucosidase
MQASQTPQCRALEVIAQMTMDEKLSFRGANPRLGLNVTMGGDGPNGIAGFGGRGGAAPQPRSIGVTAFPNEHVLAQTWDKALAARYGTALGQEFRGKGLSSITAPTIVLMRTWRWGRAAESFGEDPYLTAEMVIPELNSLQGQKVLSVLKHYAIDGQELYKTVPVDVKVSERTLNEIYLYAFREAIQRAKVGGIYCAWTSINGASVCMNPDLIGRLRQWGLDGFVTPQPGIDPVIAAKAGTDRLAGNAIDAAIKAGQLPATKLDEMVFHQLVPMFRLGIYDAPASGTAEADVSTPEHQQLAVEIATGGTVLLKNAGEVLPFEAPRVKSIAVIGDDAGPNTFMQQTNASVLVTKLSTPLDSVTRRAGTTVKVTYAQGTTGVNALPAITTSVLEPVSGEGQGLTATYYASEDWTGTPAITRIDPTVDVTASPLAPAAPPAQPQGVGGPGGRGGGPRAVYSARWEGVLTPAEAGSYRFSLSGAGTATLSLGGKPVLTLKPEAPSPAHAVVQLAAGQAQALKLEYSTRGGNGGAIRLGWQVPDHVMVDAALKAAKDSDVAVVFVGERMGEGFDKVSLNLPGDQDNLIRSIAAVNPRTVVVVHSSNPVAMPWIDSVAGVIYAGYPGQFSGDAIARVLFGDANPSGKLTVTFPANEQQGPEYPGDGKTLNYSEGDLMGYRWYDAKNQSPLFPFGHGLSYTTFKYSDLTVTGSGAQRTVNVRVTNSGRREGAEVAQLYLSDPAAAGAPPRQLKGFEKVHLKPGESAVVSMALDKQAMSVWDEATKNWKVYAGSYTASIGSSSRDIRLKSAFNVREP